MLIKKLDVLVLLVVLGLFVLTACDVSSQKEPIIKSSQETSKRVQRSSEDNAEEIRALMNFQADPCEDLWAYACGNFADPKDGEYANTLIAENALAIHKETFKNQDNIAGKFYRSCQKALLRSHADLSAVNKLISNIAPSSDSASALQAIALAHKAGSETVLFLSTVPGLQNSSGSRVHQLLIDIGLEGEPLSETEGLSEVLIDLSEVELQTALDFETSLFDLADASVSELALEEYSYAEFLDTYANLEMAGLLDSLVGTAKSEAIQNSSERTMVISSLSFMEGLGSVLEDAEGLRAYLKAQILRHYTFLAEDLAFAKEEDDGPGTDKLCEELTVAALWPFLDKIFVEKTLANTEFSAVKNMFKNIREALEENLRNADWLDDESEAAVLHKLEAVRTLLGAPSTWPSYAKIDLNRDNFTENLITLNGFNISHDLSAVLETVEGQRLVIRGQPPLSEANASYDAFANQVVINAGVLQYPSYDPSLPPAVNYGRLGSIMAHELAHGFDELGSTFNAFGRPILSGGEQGSIFSKDSAAEYAQGALCLENYYDGFSLGSGLKVDGEATLGENIADLAGIRTAFLAFANFVGDAALEADSQIEGLNNSQLFFVASSQMFCEILDNDSLKEQIESDSHAPAQARVNGPAFHARSFRKAFGCEEEIKNTCELL